MAQKKTKQSSLSREVLIRSSLAAEIGSVESIRMLSKAPLFFGPQLIALVGEAENAFARYDEHLEASPYKLCMSRLLRNTEAFALAAISGSDLPLLHFISPGGSWIHGNKADVALANRFKDIVDKYHDPSWAQRLTFDNNLLFDMHEDLVPSDETDEGFTRRFRETESLSPQTLHKSFPESSVLAPAQIQPYVDDLMSFCSQDSYSPLIQSCLAHMQINYIHPFHTLNSSLGTMLGYLVYARRSYSKNIFVDIASTSLDRIDNPVDEHKAVGENPQEPYGLWLSHAAKTMLNGVERLKKTEQRFAEIEQKWLSTMQDLHSNNICRTLARDMLALPLVSSRHIQQTYNRTAPSANSIINALLERDIITPFNKNKRYRVFYAKDAIDVYFDLFEDILPKGWTPSHHELFDI